MHPAIPIWELEEDVVGEGISRRCTHLEYQGNNQHSQYEHHPLTGNHTVRRPLPVGRRTVRIALCCLSIVRCIVESGRPRQPTHHTHHTPQPHSLCFPSQAWPPSEAKRRVPSSLRLDTLSEAPLPIISSCFALFCITFERHGRPLGLGEVMRLPRTHP